MCIRYQDLSLDILGDKMVMTLNGKQYLAKYSYSIPITQPSFLLAVPISQAFLMPDRQIAQLSYLSLGP